MLPAAAGATGLCSGGRAGDCICRKGRELHATELSRPIESSNLGDLLARRQGPECRFDLRIFGECCRDYDIAAEALTLQPGCQIDGRAEIVEPVIEGDG